MHQIILFASGKGSNVQAILDYFRFHSHVRFPLIVCNREKAGVREIAQREQIPFRLIGKQDWDSREFREQVRDLNPSLLVLAGFLWKIPPPWIEAFPRKWIN